MTRPRAWARAAGNLYRGTPALFPVDSRGLQHVAHVSCPLGAGATLLRTVLDVQVNFEYAYTAGSSPEGWWSHMNVLVAAGFANSFDPDWPHPTAYPEPGIILTDQLVWRLDVSPYTTKSITMSFRNEYPLQSHGQRKGADPTDVPEVRVSTLIGSGDYIGALPGLEVQSYSIEAYVRTLWEAA